MEGAGCVILLRAADIPVWRADINLGEQYSKWDLVKLLQVHME